MSVEALASWSDVGRHFDEMLAVEASGWKGRLGSSIVQNPKLRNFYESVCQNFAAVDALRVFLLRKDRRIVAFQICTLHAGTLTGLKSGYLEEYAKESPGQVLHLHIVRWAFSQANVRIYDMLGPTSTTKMKWATGVDELSTIYVFRQSFGGAIAGLRWALAPRAKAWLRQRLGKSRQDADDTLESAVHRSRPL
jgi:CelD/BcsL family acetyltransferase involved in cellulose biosynthesis